MPDHPARYIEETNVRPVHCADVRPGPLLLLASHCPPFASPRLSVAFVRCVRTAHTQTRHLRFTRAQISRGNVLLGGTIASGVCLFCQLSFRQLVSRTYVALIREASCSSNYFDNRNNYRCTAFHFLYIGGKNLSSFENIVCLYRSTFYTLLCIL